MAYAKTTENRMQRVFVLDKNKQPLMPTSPSRANRLLDAKKAKVYRLKPFTIILTERVGGTLQEVELKIDPGSKGSGIALVAHFEKRGLCLTLECHSQSSRPSC